ncbi:hypothetical protein SHDE107825_15335 [Shewanella denitrificans]
MARVYLVFSITLVQQGCCARAHRDLFIRMNKTSFLSEPNARVQRLNLFHNTL